MTLTDILNFSQKRQYTSEEAYREDVLKAVKLLKEFGVGNDPSQDLKTSVESIVEELHQDEIKRYGKKLSKEEIKEELRSVEAEIAALEQEEAEIDRKIAAIKSKQAS
ncbi:MAG TPA: hypothetical protein DCF68_21185 [Cyanothece sp. UBA12306]|nr:hypothetical protein [Cyanothece sp. UBA12306]